MQLLLLLLFWSVVVEVDEVGMYYAVSVRSPFVLSSLKKFFFKWCNIYP